MHVAGRHPQPDSDSSGGSSSRPGDGHFWPILPVWPYMYRCTRSRVHNKSVRCTAVIVMMDISFSSVFALCQYAYPLLKSGGRGKILTIGSEYSLHGAARMVNYASSKHAVIGMTKSLAVGWAKDNIQVNCVIPGFDSHRPGGTCHRSRAHRKRYQSQDTQPARLRAAGGYGWPDDPPGVQGLRLRHGQIHSCRRRFRHLDSASSGPVGLPSRQGYKLSSSQAPSSHLSKKKDSSVVVAVSHTASPLHSPPAKSLASPR
jgi:hypothetical protein